MRIGIRFLALIVGLSSVAGVSACSGGDDDAATDGPSSTVSATAESSITPVVSAGTFQPCSLVTQEQAEEVLGYAIFEPRLTDEGSACVYEEEDPNNFGGTVLVSPATGFELYDSVGGEPQDVPGLGEKATYYPDILALVVQQDGYYVVIETRLTSAEDERAISREFAALALEALP